MSERCCERVWQEYRWGECARDATVERNGEWYCWQHDPEYVASKETKRRVLSEARWRRVTNQMQRTAAERAACVDVSTDVLEKVRVADLLEENEALRALLTLLLSDPSDNSINAVWVDENYNPASPGDDGIRWFLTPYQIAEHKARVALKNIPTGEK